MCSPGRTTLVAMALGLGVLWAGSPARAQVTGGDEAIRSQPAEPPSADAPPETDAPILDLAPAPAPSAEPASAQPDEAAASGRQEGAPPEVAPQANDVAPAAADAAQATAPLDADAQPAAPLTRAAGRVADWVRASGDNGGLPFVIVDKPAADIFVFDADGGLRGAAPALVGLARGDDSAPGVGDRDLSTIQPDERTTPAGRFLASFGPAAGGRRVLWVDYADAISLHPVVTNNPEERRLERLRSAAAEDHRISYGCINVPADFYNDVVLKAFADGSGVVYILPDTRPLEEVFPALPARPDAAASQAANDENAQPATGAQSPVAAALDAVDAAARAWPPGADTPPASLAAGPPGAPDELAPQPALVAEPMPPAPDTVPDYHLNGLAADPNDPPPKVDTPFASRAPAASGTPDDLAPQQVSGVEPTPSTPDVRLDQGSPRAAMSDGSGGGGGGGSARRSGGDVASPAAAHRSHTTGRTSHRRPNALAGARHGRHLPPRSARLSPPPPPRKTGG